MDEFVCHYCDKKFLKKESLDHHYTNLHLVEPPVVSTEVINLASDDENVNENFAVNVPDRSVVAGFEKAAHSSSNEIYQDQEKNDVDEESTMSMNSDNKDLDQQEPSTSTEPTKGQADDNDDDDDDDDDLDLYMRGDDDDNDDDDSEASAKSEKKDEKSLGTNSTILSDSSISVNPTCVVTSSEDLAHILVAVTTTSALHSLERQTVTVSSGTLGLGSSSGLVPSSDVTKIHSYSLASAAVSALSSGCNMQKVVISTQGKHLQGTGLPHKAILTTPAHAQIRTGTKRLASVASSRSDTLSSVNTVTDIVSLFALVNKLLSGLISSSDGRIPSIPGSPKSKIMDHFTEKLRLLKCMYYHQQAEYFFLESGGNIIDLVWKKELPTELLEYLTANKFDSYDDEKVITECLLSWYAISNTASELLEPQENIRRLEEQLRQAQQSKQELEQKQKELENEKAKLAEAIMVKQQEVQRIQEEVNLKDEEIKKLQEEVAEARRCQEEAAPALLDATTPQHHHEENDDMVNDEFGADLSKDDSINLPRPEEDRITQVSKEKHLQEQLKELSKELASSEDDTKLTKNDLLHQENVRQG